MFPFTDSHWRARLLTALVRSTHPFLPDVPALDRGGEATTPVTPKLLTLREAAEFLRVCEKTVYNLGDRGELPAVRIGTRVLYDQHDLSRWIASHKTFASK